VLDTFAAHSKFSCSHHYPRVTHFSDFISFLSNGVYSWFPLPTKSYTPVLRHNLSERLHPDVPSRTCDHPPPLTCTSLALIFISVHAHVCSNSLEFSPEFSSLVSNLKYFPKHLKTQSAFNSPSDLSSASDLFYWMIMALSQILLLTYLLTYCTSASSMQCGVLRVCVERVAAARRARGMLRDERRQALWRHETNAGPHREVAASEPTCRLRYAANSRSHGPFIRLFTGVLCYNFTLRRIEKRVYC